MKFAALLFIVFLSCFQPTKADAAASVVLRWKYEGYTTCANGEPLSECPVTGFEIQEQKAGSPIWLILKGVGPDVFTYTVPDLLVAGEVRCYRFRVNSGGTFSKVSKEFCTNKVPNSEPNTVTNVEISITIKPAMNP